MARLNSGVIACLPGNHLLAHDEFLYLAGHGQRKLVHKLDPVRDFIEEEIMSRTAKTPGPPYYAVIFSSIRTEGDNGYGAMAERMLELAAQQQGFLGVESAREGLGITVSYWDSIEAIRNWKQNAEHLEAQRLGHQVWYSEFKVRIAKIERDYGI